MNIRFNTEVIDARHTLLGRIEEVIHVCELEGIETLATGGFFQNADCPPSPDNFFGRPVFVFHSGPEMPWAGCLNN